jgi:hypothetical protein
MEPQESEPSEIPGGASTAGFSPQGSPTKATAFARISLWANQLESMFVRRLLVIAVLGAMVMIGLFLSNYSSEKARYYWCAMFPIFGLACLAHELTINRVRELAMSRLLLRQALHWIGPIVAVKILFLQYARGQMASDAVALTTILLLAVTCFLAGVHFDGSFYWVGALLVMAAVIGTEIESYLWLVAVVFLIGVAITIVSATLLYRRPRAATTSKPPPVA